MCGNGLHVHGRRISGRVRRRRKFTDSYPFLYKKKEFFIGYVKVLGLFDDLVESTLLAGGKSQKKEEEMDI
jgi:hypothetical protein